jgi:outer membrane protein assembly factor BamB
MRRIILLCSVLMLCGVAVANGDDWPGWRGPRGDGTSHEKGLPTKWNGETGGNIAWKTGIPGVGHSSPIVWRDRIFLMTCEPEKKSRILICLDRSTGKKLWQSTIIKSPLELKHHLNSYASGTPVTDGERVYVTFLETDGDNKPDPNDVRKKLRSPGQMVVAAYDMDGKRQWLVRPGGFASVHGYCSSPVLFGDLVIVNGDHDGDAYLVALDRKTGLTRWKIDRENKVRSYSTPIIRRFDDRTQMILSGSKSVASYDPATGKRHWVIDGPTEQFVASVVDNGKLLFVTAGFPERHMLAIRPDGRGNVTRSHIVWRTRKSCSYVPSPVAVGDWFVVVSDSGVASCLDAATGKAAWIKRLGSRHSASLVTAGGLVYFTADTGKTNVVRIGPEFDLVAENELGEHCDASPAISSGQIFIRGEKHLFCIGRVKK